jgi:endo-1,4-beta-xylanase
VTRDKTKTLRAAVIIIPGGGHKELWVDHEGNNLAQWLSARGIAAFVLKYRLAREPNSTYTVDDHALADTKRAIRLVRSRAQEWGIAPSRVGVIGFSAGGELAALSGMRFDSGNKDATDHVKLRINRRHPIPSTAWIFSLSHPHSPLRVSLSLRHLSQDAQLAQTQRQL